MNLKIKAYLCRACSTLISIGTPFAVIFASPNMFFYKPESSISTLAIMAIICSCFAFKDSIMKFTKTPSALKVWIAVFVLAMLGQFFVKQIIVLAAFSAVAQVVCIPINNQDRKFIERDKLMQEAKLKKEIDNEQRIG